MDVPEERPYRVSLACDGVPSAKAEQAAIDIAEEFTHRPWQEKVECRWTGTSLILVAENDFDSDGRALSGEFSDAIAMERDGVYQPLLRSSVEVVEAPTSRETTKSYKETDREEGNYPRRTV